MIQVIYIIEDFKQHFAKTFRYDIVNKLLTKNIG